MQVPRVIDCAREPLCKVQGAVFDVCITAGNIHGASLAGRTCLVHQD
jgi:hypothetical protein